MTSDLKKQEVFEFNGAFYTIPIDPQESREMYVERVWFVLGKIVHDEAGNADIDKIILQSRQWSNSKHLGCKYKK